MSIFHLRLGNPESRSDKLQEILFKVPNWLMRWGISSIGFAIAIILIVSWFIKYPEIINSKIIISSLNAPVNIIAPSSGRIVSIFVKENDIVVKGSYLAVIENSAKFVDIMNLKKELENIKMFLIDPSKSVNFKAGQNATYGDLQFDYANLQRNYLDYKTLMEEKYAEKKAVVLEKQIEYSKMINDNFLVQNELLQNEFSLLQKQYNNEKILKDKGLLSEQDLMKTEDLYLQKKQALEMIKSNIVSNNLQKTEYEKNIMELSHQFDVDRKKLIQAIEDSYKQIENSINNWEQKYILKSPIDGKVTFLKFCKENEFVVATNEVISIVPDSNDLRGKVYMPVAGSGKVKVGQKINIKIDNYPYYEFGIVQGEIESISMVPKDNTYLVNVLLPFNLNTSYNKQLEFKNEMSGTAEIITEDLRLSDRIFYQFLKLFNNSQGN